MVCESLEQVRDHIDHIDKQIIQLIAQRGHYVEQAAKFKKSNQDVQALQRVEAVIQKVRNLSEEYGAHPDMVETLYRDMIAGFISMEMKAFNQNGKELR